MTYQANRRIALQIIAIAFVAGAILFTRSNSVASVEPATNSLQVSFR